MLAHIKCNVGPEMPSLLYEIQPILLPGDGEQPPVESSRLRLLGESEYDARSILALPSGEARSAMEEAIDFLKAELGDGERHSAGELTRVAPSLGISTGTLHAARTRLGVKTERSDSDVGWEWWLPKIQRPAEPSQSARTEPSRGSFTDAGLEADPAPEDSASDTLNLGIDEEEIEGLAEIARQAAERVR